MTPVVSRHHGLLGTVIELHLWVASPERVDAVETAVITEIERLQHVFDVHDAASDLRRWSAGDVPPSPELAQVLALAATWRHRSGGAFDPAVGPTIALWDDAARRGSVPTPEAIAEVVAATHDPSDDRSRPSNLNALAKGWIVDRSLERGLAVDGAVGLTVSAGGDLAHHAPQPLVVGIEDPANPYDNVAPLLRVRVEQGALATSGGARRGWRIGGDWYSHVIDPRSGRPVGHVASASVLAPDAATADAVATVIGIVQVDEGLAFVDRFEGVSCCIVTADGAVHRDHGWAARELAD